MNGFGFRKNTVFDWSGSAFLIDRIQENGDVLLVRIDDGLLSIQRLDHLLSEYREGRISASANDSVRTIPHDAKMFSRPLDELSSQVQSEVRRRYRYLQAIFGHDDKVVYTRELLTPLIHHVAEEMNDQNPPSATTIYRWNRLLQQSKDSRALIPRFDRRGSKNMKQNSRLLQLARDAIGEAFQASPHATGQSINTRLAAKVNSENHFLPKAEQLKLPCLRTIYRMLGRVEAYDQAVLKDGKALAEKKFLLAKFSTETTQILERVEIDHTPLDLFLIDEKSLLPLGRPTLTVAIDHFSRMPIGYHLSFGNPSVAAVMGALRHSILPKLLASGPLPNLKIEHAWPCHGVPKVIVVDNGLEFYSGDLDSVALDLGLAIQFCPKHQPRFKGTVERYLKTINYFFAHQLPGTSLARWHLRGDYDPTKHAVLTLAEFNQIFEKWILDDYAQVVHRGMHETPWARWHASLKHRVLELPSSVNVLEERIGHIKERSLRRDGITLFGNRYNGDALASILNSHGAGIKVRVMYNNEDLSSIRVWGPDSEQPLRVLALNQEYTKGLTSLQNELMRAVIHEKGASQTDPVALQQARQDIIETVESLMNSRKQKDRRKAATILGMSSSKPQESLTGGLAQSPSNDGHGVSNTKPKTRSKPDTGSADTDIPPIKYTFFQPIQDTGCGSNQ